ncbi:hypothetical protein BU24DRAFT_163691 [Aaosphaeria arxii CBS 175.79]|uniref:Uncharacterized protein n=1 Tax=Aaosphaeria arxii CBS 175.79 TaxID=1450172 RepID=A0A6A5XYM7_9PLEO|nr:uncharacterized protein BU24DRAFT_163691 [Aaosphaeria arxii CBS 175.79]KAF2018033.1 hypothetical protein BU24DRAFT_163691 [Aaosphaeria arxii CBS 175.79]
MRQHPNPLRSNPVRQELRTQSSTDPYPVTPIHNQAGPSIPSESVVSPFFKSQHQVSRLHTKRAAIAEQQRSSHHFDAYPSPRTQTTPMQPNWRGVGGLNGLSFFDSPVNNRNERILYSKSLWPPRPEQPTTLLTPRRTGHDALDRRVPTDTTVDRSTAARNRYSHAHGSEILSRPLYNQVGGFPRTTLQSTPAFKRLPSALPTFVKAPSSRSNLNRLVQTGVRGSQTSRMPSSQSLSSSPRLTLFPDFRRRSIKR